MAEHIFKGDKFLGIIHEKDGKWYAVMPRKNVHTRTFKTCGNGIVRLPSKCNHCSEAMTWDTKEEATLFLHNINFLFENTVCYVVFRNADNMQLMRGIFFSEEGARECIAQDLRANPKWKWIDFVIQEAEVEP